MGPLHSGKTQTMIGNLRDPGLILYLLQDIFNQIEDKFLEDNVTIKVSAFSYNRERGFQDLLVENNFEFKAHSVWSSENSLLGIPEIIVDNFLLGMKILRMGVANLNKLEQTMDTEQYYGQLHGNNIVFEVRGRHGDAY